MRHLVHDFLEHRLSRRDFAKGLAALGIAAASVESVVQAAEAAERGGAVKTLEGTGGQILVAQMKEAGVKFVFTNPGSYEVGFFEALFEEWGNVHLIMGLHEGMVIAMADGYHKVSREPAFVNLHVIAGTAQAAGQMYNASRDGSALIVTAGLLDNEVFSDNIVLGPRPGFNQKEINRQFTKRATTATTRRCGTPTIRKMRRPLKIIRCDLVLGQVADGINDNSIRSHREHGSVCLVAPESVDFKLHPVKPRL